MDYIDFTIEISAEGTDRYKVETRGLAGDACEEFLPPYAPEALASSLWGLPQEESCRDIATVTNTHPPEAMGERLFQALMPGQVRNRFNECLGRADAEGRGVRIKLRLDPVDPSASWLGLIPWEALYLPGRGEALGLSRRTPISRDLTSSYPASPPPFSPPLRVLAAMPRPQGVTRLDLDRERLHLQRSWSEGTGAEVDLLERTTVDELRERLCQRWDVLHFMGHGGFDTAERAGYLVFEDENGGPERVRDRRLAVLLQGAERPRLVVLNACETARTSAEGTGPTATGAAPMLVRAGIPAVVAMLHPIADRAAVLFSRTLHGRLAAGDPVDVAVTEGRRALHGRFPSLEWAKPVVFMRVADGRLFDADPRTLKAPEPPSPSTVEADMKEIDSENVTIGAVINEGCTAPQGNTPSRARLQADRVKSRRILFGGTINLSDPGDGDPS